MAIIGVAEMSVQAISPDVEGTYHFRGPFPNPQFRILMPRPGTLDKYQAYVPTNLNDVEMILDLLVEGVSVSSIVVPALATGKFPTTPLGPFSVNARDGVSFRARAAGTSGSAIFSQSVEYQPG